MSSVLVVCQTDRIPDPVCKRLKDDGHIVQLVSEQSSGTFLANVPVTDLVVFVATSSQDWVLGLLADYRHSGGRLPVIVVCHKEKGLTNADIVNAGGDAIVYNPYDNEEISARVRSIIERNYAFVDLVYVVDGLIFDPKTNQLWFQKQAVSFGLRESSILKFLLAHPGQNFSCRQLIERLGLSECGTDYSVRTSIMKLRKKISGLGAKSIIKSRYGRGYQIAQVSVKERHEVLSGFSQ
ncbi:MAG: winged helix-turn-helix domain-containing protein [Candidatus Obscuribacterales bacterium]|nr:winged helix-turn-helix domain-containing protein [Candidatus Obscuribacterales bacterium]